MRLVWALDVRHLVAHRTRLALSALGIAAGVALAVAVGSLNSSISAGLRSVAEATASRANLEIRPNGPTGLPPQVLGSVRTATGVREAGATVESYVRLRRGQRTERVLVIGIDQGILAMAPRSVDANTVRTSDPFGLVLPAPVAIDLGVDAGDEIEITTPTGWRPINVGTVIDEPSAARTRIALGTVGVLQGLLGRGDRFDVVYVQADDPDRTLRSVQEAVGPVGRVGPVALRADDFQQLLAGANASFQIGSIVALFVGAFLVFNTMSMAAVERLQEAALLRAVGARRRQVFALFCAEGALLGCVGSALGIAGGVLLSGRLLSQRGGPLEEVFPIQITNLEVEPRQLVLAATAGIVSALFAALLPARRIARADPAPALGPAGVLEDPTRAPRRLTTVLGLACIAGAVAIALTFAFAGQISNVALLSFVLGLLGVALLIPVGVPLVARALYGTLARARRTPGVARLAAGEVLRSPGRTAFTTGAVLLALALVVGFAIGQGSFQRGFEAEFEEIISADLYIRSPTWRPLGSDVPIDDGITDEVERIPGVVAAWPFRIMPATLDGRSILVLAYDLQAYAQHSRRTGDSRREAFEQARLAAGRDVVLASASVEPQLGYRVGDVIELPTPTGLRRLPITGTFPDPGAINPELVFDHDTFKRVWGTGGADTIGVRVNSRDDTVRMKRELERRLGPRFGVEVDTNEEYATRLNSVVRSVGQLIGSVQLVAVIVAGLGLANTLLISTLERRRDLGVLRAVGMLRRQMRRMVAAEALMIGGLGVLGAWGLGTLLGYGIYSFIRSQLGIPIDLVLPLTAYAGAAVLGIAAALVASLYPAHRAARIDVVDALQYE